MDDLIKRLEGQGKKVKIIHEGDEGGEGNDSDDKESPDIRRESTFMEQKMKEMQMLEQEK